MKGKAFKIVPILLILVMLASALVGCATHPEEQATTRTITDMLGRTVEIPTEINKVVTVGAVPIINGYIFAMGEGDKIANGLPAFAQKTKKYQILLAPQIANEPVLQGASRGVNIEELLKVNPDVVFTMSKDQIEVMERNNIPVVFLSCRNANESKQIIKLMGEIFNKPSRARDYINYFNATVDRVDKVVSSISVEKKPKVLYCMHLNTVTHLIVDWWINKAGGISVSSGKRSTEKYQFDKEQLLKWDPDILIVSTPDEFNRVYNDPVYNSISAVKNKKVYIGPIGIFRWCHRDVEMPLTVLWAAKIFYPDKFKDVDLEKETMDFYRKFFNYNLSRKEAKEILSGRLGEK